MKLSSIIMILIVIQAVILVYDDVYSPGDDVLASYNSNDTEIWDFAVDPTGWTGTSLLVRLLGITAISSLIGVGVYLVTKSDTALFFGLFSFLLGVGSIPIISLYQVFTRNAPFFGCEAIAVGESLLGCTPALISWVLTGGILAIFFVLAVLGWWSNRAV